MVDVHAVPAVQAGPASLAELAADLPAGRELRVLLERLLEPILQRANARAGAVRMLSADGIRLELVASLGLPPSLTDAERVAPLCGFCGQSTSEHRIAWAADLSHCKVRTGDPFFDTTCRRGMAIPLECKGRLFGIYNLFFEEGEVPAPAEQALLQGIGELLGLALDNHRLEAENLRVTVSRERRLMAADVHDAVAQNLAFVKMRLPLLRDAIEAGDKKSALSYLEDARETLGEAHRSLREIITHFRTRVDPRGLAQALELLAENLRTRTGIALHMDHQLAQLDLPEPTRADLYRIVQEALANIERHSLARNAWLSLTPTVGGVELHIEDDGVGPLTGGVSEPDHWGPDHWGLEIMRERAQRLGGELQVGPREGGGTSVRCTFLLPAAEAS